MDREQAGNDRMISVREAELDEIVDRAAERGADRALQKVGLENGEAARDLSELRGLAKSLREARSTAGQTIVRILTILIIGGIITAVGLKSKLLGL